MTHKGKMNEQKIGIIWVKDSINTGDDVQTVAMQEVVKRCKPNAEIVWCDRETLHKPNEERITHLIVSGWFMKSPEHWPIHPTYPNPLFISFHISREQKVDIKLISERHREFWISNSPIGCRDWGTQKVLNHFGIDSWFSGCATLTIKRPRTPNPNPYILVADPFYHLRSKSFDSHQLKRLLGKKPEHRIINITNFDPKRPQKSQSARLDEINHLFETINNAEFVITSRIHIALPATAMGIPVYFINSGYDRTEHSRDRFDGLISLFNVIDEKTFAFASRKRLGKLQRLLRLHKFEKSNLSHLLNVHHQHKKHTESMEIASKIEGVVLKYVNSTHEE